MAANVASLTLPEVAPDYFQQNHEVRQRVVANTSSASLSSVDWSGVSHQAIPGQWVLGFHEGSQVSSISQAQSLFRAHGLPLEVVGGLGNRGQFLVQAQGSFDGTFGSLIPLLRYAEPNLVATPQRVPNDPLFPREWGLRQSNDRDIDATEAWDVTTGKSSVVIGVIDTGIDYRHPDLQANMWRNPGEIPNDQIDNDQNGLVDDYHGFDFVNWNSNPMDINGHGTHVAGTIGAVGNNGLGVSGVAWKTSLMALQIAEGNQFASLANIIASINYTTLMKTNFGIDIRANNASWRFLGYVQSLEEAIALNGAADILFVAAAGNDSQNIDSSPVSPASSSLNNVVSVAAVDASGKYAAFSNHGAISVDLAAPGVGILSTVPGGNYGFDSGTSMAAPHVAGTVALIAAANPELNVAQIKRILLETGDPLADRSKRTVTNRSLNANQAVRRAISTAGPADQFGVYDPSRASFMLDIGMPGYQNEQPIVFGNPGNLPVVGDWDGDGRDELGSFQIAGGLSYFFLDSGRLGYDGERPIQFGHATDLPISGDWNGDGVDEVGVYRSSTSTFYLDTGAPGYQNEVGVQFGLPGDKPIVGDWDGDGIDQLGVFRPSSAQFFLDLGARGYQGEAPFSFGFGTDEPFAGDFDGDGRDQVAVFRTGTRTVIYDLGNKGYTGEVGFQFLAAGSKPLAGRWTPSIETLIANSQNGNVRPLSIQTYPLPLASSLPTQSSPSNRMMSREGSEQAVSKNALPQNSGSSIEPSRWDPPSLDIAGKVQSPSILHRATLRRAATVHEMAMLELLSFEIG